MLYPETACKRKWKRYENRMMGYRNARLYEAYTSGELDGMRGNPNRNPYPAGRRHAEYERGYALKETRP